MSYHEPLGRKTVLISFRLFEYLPRVHLSSLGMKLHEIILPSMFFFFPPPPSISVELALVLKGMKHCEEL